ncbi:glycine betaine ABC transporter substrate-binding protein [Pseudomonas protegens]|jgi:glycine betaine/proline transport system substrate-binding protein|uniref:Glycine betaine-binding protein n=1 Tax=Pseudomonas protegens (strain DSM 19095 / LMG 27888 / CFBP 6595 / CHA0) TaxID=1124983 RepID=A0A2C9EIP9_PSEPH|nr:glycine betaine ABC transporter substrate-binding protein [Pseudomonas protegens]AGL83536.1 glycine betaine-binding protein [Pseudomonas protegens CHA0]MBF0642554.1 glycine betaine ABC transporter substrate-binding protein [Pseudomonas protegens]MBP5111707.1 glycine betaine ABC transporter substrate-binding protein [Pseudomonas protegens]QTU24991.1 glycine betaine ABC transporter substrate-binding protein [Pseudomonas protegens]QTU34520.1 glycine betaine ABC transporter substrate-binding pr
MKMRRLLGAGAALVLAISSTLASADSKTLSIGYVDGWSDSVATTHVAAEVIKQKLGYDVKLQAVATGIMWQGVATGKLDAMLSAWLPVTHGEYWAKNKDKVVDYGPNFKDAKIGLIVPEYVKAKSIEDLKIDTTFKNKIVGIDAGSGVMLKTDQAIKDYGLDYKLQASSGAAMIAELTRAEEKQDSIAVTGWVPHWMFAKWKLRFLEDPKGVYGAAETVNSIGSKGLEKKAPEVAAFLKKFQWASKDEIGEVMLAIQEGAKPDVAAKDWVSKHPERVAEWTAK